MGYVQKKLPWKPIVFSKKKSLHKTKKWKQQKIFDSLNKQEKPKPEKEQTIMIITGYDSEMNFIFLDDDM